MNEPEHVPGFKQTIKLDSFDPVFKARCECGWVGNGIFGTAREALKSARQHVKGRENHVKNEERRALREAINEADNTHPEPQAVIDALRTLVVHYDVSAYAWERATTGIVVFSGDGWSGATRYVLSPDLQTILHAERPPRQKQS